MKINRLEAHDRLLHFKKDQESNIVQGFNDCLFKNPLSLALQEKSDYIYIFAHPRTHDDGVTKRMLFQPRLRKPSMQTNSYLVRVKSHTDLVDICWMLPPREMWDTYKKGNVTENEIVLWSIEQFNSNRAAMEMSDPQDLTEEQSKNIYLAIAKEMDEEKRNKEIKQAILEPFSIRSLKQG